MANEIGDVMAPEKFSNFLDESLKSRHPWVHSRWSQMLLKRELAHKHLQSFAKQFEHFLRGGPRHYFCLGANCPDVIPDNNDLRRMYAEHLVGHMGLEREGSFALFRRFAYSIGLTKEEMDDSVALPTTIAFNHTYIYVLKNSPYIEGMAAVHWANESLYYLGLTELWVEALTKHYGVSKDNIFLPPAGRVLEHVKTARKLVLEYAVTPRAQSRIKEIFNIVFAGWSVFFDGLYYAYVKGDEEHMRIVS